MGLAPTVHRTDDAQVINNASQMRQPVADLAAQLATELGSTACTTLAAVTAAADVIFTVVTDDASMRAIFLEGDDTLLVGAAGKTFINCATVSPAIHREGFAAAQAASADSLEASMASSISHARDGQLYLMLAGDEAVYHRLLPLLEKMSVNRRFIGGPGRAAEVKALVNMVMNINTAGLAEGLGLGNALGLDLNMLREVFLQTGANTQVLKTDGEDMQNRDHACYFSGAHAAKDSTIAWVLGAEAGINMPLASATKQQFDKMVALGLGNLDKSGVAELTFKGRHA